MNISDALFTVVDTETTGLDSTVDRVVEFAMVRADVRGIGGTWSSLFDPGIPIPAAASAVHHLVDSDVQGYGLFIANWKPNPSNMPHGDIYAAHNAAFDSKFIPQIANDPMICTMRLAKKLWPQLEGYGNQFLRYQLGLEIPAEFKAMSMHRALPDAVVTACLLIRELGELARQHSEIGTVESLVEWLATPILLYRCGFGKHGPKDGKPGTLWKDVPKDYLRWMLSTGGFDEDVMFTAGHYCR